MRRKLQHGLSEEDAQRMEDFIDKELADEEEPTTEELDAAYRQSMAFNTEAARSGLFAAALDIADTMRSHGVPNGEACLMTGALEFAVQLWFQVSAQAGVMPNRARDTLMKEVWDFWDKHRRLNASGGAPQATKQ